MQHYWFGDVEDGHCYAADQDTRSLAERVNTLRTGMDTFIPLSWEQAVECGFVASRDEYISRLRNLCIHIAEHKIADFYKQGDIELLQMVRMLDEMDNVTNLLTERATEWYLVRNPGFSRKYRSMSAKKMLAVIRRERDSPLGKIAAEIDRLAQGRAALMREVNARAVSVAPNCSALVGGLVAARLISRAGGLAQLARLPASTIQVLGAENALFTHLRAGTPSPKHGIIFQHRRVHNAPREVRGKVARVLAAKLSIAARLDYYRGEQDEDFLERAQKRIDAAGGGA